MQTEYSSLDLNRVWVVNNFKAFTTPVILIIHGVQSTVITGADKSIRNIFRSVILKLNKGRAYKYT